MRPAKSKTFIIGTLIQKACRLLDESPFSLTYSLFFNFPLILGVSFFFFFRAFHSIAFISLFIVNSKYHTVMKMAVFINEST